MKMFYNKGRYGLVLMVVLALILQIVGPLVSDYAYAEESKQELSQKELTEKELIAQEKQKEKEKLEEEEQVEEKEQEEQEEEKQKQEKNDEEQKDNEQEDDLKLSEEEIKENAKQEDQEEKEEEEEVQRESQKITENIIDGMRLLYKNGSEIPEDELINIKKDDLRFELDWSIPNGHEYIAGDYFEFKLPKQINISSPLNNVLGEYGTYTVDVNGNVKFTFNEKIESESEIKGTFWINTKLIEKEITKVEETIELVINGEVVQKIIVNVKPTGGQDISKNGQPVDGSFNTEEVEWTVIVNTSRESLKDAIITDPIFADQELILKSLVLKEVEVDSTGKVIKELDEITGFTNNSTTENLSIELGDTNKAYKLTFKTKLLEKDFKEGTTNYKNDATLKSDGIKDAQAGGSVSVSRPKSMEKTSTEFDKGNRSVEWTVNANFTEQNLKKDDVITDEFTFTVGKDELKDVFEIKSENIIIVQVDKFDDKGEVTETSNAKDLFDITVEGNKVTYKLKKDTNKAFILEYKTELKKGAYINKDGKITNKIDLNGKTSSSSQGVVQQVGKKTNAGINYEDKTIDWTITVNADKQDLRNFVLTDSFAGTGQKLVADSIKIKPADSGATITPNTDNEGFEIDFGDIEEAYIITYQTKFTYDFENKGTYEEPITPDFKNGVKITYETSDGSDYVLEFGNTVPPNSTTKSNGAKNGTVDQKTKEITWKIDINYNQLSLDNAIVTDVIPDNQSLIDGSVKIYETSIAKNGDISVGTEVASQFISDTDKNKVNVTFGKIDKSYRIEFKTKDKDGIYNKGELYENTAQFIPREGEVHNLTANVTLPNQGQFLGKTGRHNKEDWTIDWKIDVNKSLSTTSDFTVTDDLGDPTAQILLEETIKVRKAGSTGELEEGEGKDYKLTVNGNKFEIYIPGKIMEAYEITYSSYIVAEEKVDVTNDAKIQSNDAIRGTTSKTETIEIIIADSGGSGEGTTGSLVIDKFESGSNRKLEDVSFKLTKRIGNKNIVVRDGITDIDGKLEWKGLKYGKYTLSEVIPEGYLGEKEREVEISSKNKGIKTLSIENTRKTGKARIIKVDSVTGNLLEGAEFTLINGTTKQEYTFTTDNDGVVLEEIPFGEYTVKEITAPKGYRITNNIPNINVEIDKTATIEIENVAFVDVAGEKSWIVDKDEELPKEIIVKLLADGKEIKEEKITKDSDWKYSFKNLDKYNKAGREIDYQINEVKIDGYIVEQDGYNLTNIQATSISGIKTWIDDNNPERPKKITVQLLANDEKVEDRSIDVTETSGWKYSFVNLPKYDTSGKKIIYTIEELAVEGYKSEIKNFNIINTRKAKTSVKGEKSWKDEDPTDRPDEIKVNLTREINGEKDKDFSETKVVKPNAQGKWLYEFDDLEEFNNKGVAYTYIIKEFNVPEKYQSNVDNYNITNTRVGKTELSGTKRWKDDRITDRPESITVNLLRNNVVVETKDITAKDNWKYSFTELEKYDEDGKYYEYKVKEEQVPGYAPSIAGNDITNTRSEKTSIEITKGWLDDNSEERPDKIIVYVYQNKKLFETVELEADKNWIYELTGIEAYDKDGKPYIYTVQEKKLEGYDTIIDGFNITNLRVGKRDLEVDKVWIGPKAGEVEMTLHADGVATDKTLKLNKANEWKDSFRNLDKYNKVNGKLIDYTVVETKVKNYNQKLTGTMEDGFTVTNTYVSPKTQVTGNKIWVGGPAQRPTIELQLYRNGETLGSPVELKDGKKEYIWTNLDLTDENGKEYIYTIDEVNSPKNYNKLISKDGLTVTNKYSPPVYDKDTLELLKLGEDNKLLPGAVFELVQNGMVQFTSEPTDLSGIVRFTNIPYGTYTVREKIAPEGYVLGTAAQEVTITRGGQVKRLTFENTKIKGDIKLVKVDSLGKPLQGAEFKLYDSKGEEVGTSVVSDKDGIVVFKDIAYGNYTIKETKAPEGYKLSDKIYKVSVKENGILVSQDIDGRDLRVENKQLGTIKINKVDKDDSAKLLAGAIFEVRDSKDKVVGTITTGKDGQAVIKDLEYGKYTIVETKAPEGYKLDNSSYSVDVNSEKTVIELTITNTIDPTDPEDPTDPTDPEDPDDPDKPDPEDPTDPSDSNKPNKPGDPTDPSKPNKPGKPTDPTKPADPSKPSDPAKPGKPGGHEDGDLVQTGTDINFLIPIGFIIMLIGLAYVYKEKLIKE